MIIYHDVKRDFIALKLNYRISLLSMYRKMYRIAQIPR